MTSSNFVAISMVSKFGADIPFQLGTFFLLVTAYKNTILKVNDHSPGFLGPVMICMTKEEHTLRRIFRVNSRSLICQTRQEKKFCETSFHSLRVCSGKSP